MHEEKALSITISTDRVGDQAYVVVTSRAVSIMPAMTSAGGNVVTGLLYELSRMALVAFAILVQLACLPIFAVARSREPNYLTQQESCCHHQDHQDEGFMGLVTYP